MFNAKLSECGIPPFAAAVGREFKPHKPAPDSALYILKELEEIPSLESAWFVGDGVHDLACANAAKMSSILVRNCGDEHDEAHVQHTRSVEQQNIHSMVFDDLNAFRKELERIAK
jgi:phosphoglycolate phosphatase-like HAD superfamily hydrolase